MMILKENVSDYYIIIRALMLWLFEQFPSYIRLNDIVKTHLSFNGIVRMLYTLNVCSVHARGEQMHMFNAKHF